MVANIGVVRVMVMTSFDFRFSLLASFAVMKHWMEFEIPDGTAVAFMHWRTKLTMRCIEGEAF